MNNTFYSFEDYVYYLAHGGPGSGRYPKGSGKNPFQHVKGAFRDAGEKWFSQNVKTGKDKAPVSKAEKTTKELSKMFGEASNAAGRMGNMQRRKAANRSNAKQLSEKELRDAIGRMRLEREYNSLAYNETPTKYDKAQDVLSTVETLISMGASAATIASILYGIKHPSRKDD